MSTGITNAATAAYLEKLQTEEYYKKLLEKKKADEEAKRNRAKELQEENLKRFYKEKNENADI